MAILIDETKRVLVQGSSGREGQTRTRLMGGYERKWSPVAHVAEEQMREKPNEPVKYGYDGRAPRKIAKA